MKKAIIFDMDGLMIDSENLCCDIYLKVAKEMNLNIDKEYYISTIGSNKEQEIKMFYKTFGEDFPMDEYWERTHTLLDQSLKEKVPLKKGLIELLEYLKENNYKTIVATSSERHRVNEILKNAKIESYFDDVICGDEVSNSKPDPEIFVTACKKLNVLKEEALILEDSEAGILAAHRGEIDVICIPDMILPSSTHQNMAIKVYDSLLDVLSYLKENNHA